MPRARSTIMPTTSSATESTKPGLARVTRTPAGPPAVYAPHGYADLFAKRVRPNPRLAPRAVYEAKARRWRQEWPSLVVDPWPVAAEEAG